MAGKHPSHVQLKSDSLIQFPRAPSYLNSRFLAFVTIGNIEPRTHYLGNWSPGGWHFVRGVFSSVILGVSYTQKARNPCTQTPRCSGTRSPKPQNAQGKINLQLLRAPNCFTEHFRAKDPAITDCLKYNLNSRPQTLYPPSLTPNPQTPHPEPGTPRQLRGSSHRTGPH